MLFVVESLAQVVGVLIKVANNEAIGLDVVSCHIVLFHEILVDAVRRPDPKQNTTVFRRILVETWEGQKPVSSDEKEGLLHSLGAGTFPNDRLREPRFCPGEVRVKTRAT